VVLDEPNASLDADGEKSLGRAIQTLRRNGSIVIVISHRPSALAFLNMAMVLYEGRAIAFGPREEIFARIRTEAARPAPGPQPAAARNAQPVRRAVVAGSA
jgi:ATP-binding cassette subfamily C protein PrsD